MKNLNKKYKRVIQLELNEISVEAISRVIERGGLPNFAKICNSWKFLKTESEKNYEEIEPWIQWVTVHTGKTLAEHSIFRLSDAHQLEHSQIWEELSKHSIESAIIGSMNTLRRKAKGGVFIPDPWAQSNETYPDELKPLWQFLAAKVQQHATSTLSIKDLLEAFRCCRKIGLPYSLYIKIIRQLFSQKLNSKTRWKLAGIFDVFLGEIFKSILRTTNFGFYTLFLNAIAHYQHHYWRAFDISHFDSSISYSDIRENDDPMLYGYMVYDKIIGEVLDIVAEDKDTLVLIVSGLSQVPFNLKESEGGMNYYRLNDHKQFAQSIGLRGEVFPMMSRDWQYKYTSEKEREVVLSILGNMTVNNDPLFLISENTEGYIYIETAYTKGNTSEAKIYKSGESIGNFNDYFTNIAVKSGHHTGLGNLWISDPDAILIPNGAHIPLTSVFHIGLNALV
jgi:hypothetical protein